ncbi:hypothetical protein BLOT_016864 [Blomia tropicalis]|nr:hypothetical protein BLOT_016864 [Blomia tropicalis]
MTIPRLKLEFFIRIVELYPTWLESGLEIFNYTKRYVLLYRYQCHATNLINIEKLDRIMVDYMDLEITPKEHFLTHYNELIRFYGTFNHIQRPDSNQRMAKTKSS